MNCRSSPRCPAVGAAALGDKIADEVSHVGFGLKPDQVVLQQLREQPVVVRQHRHHFRGGERHVEKKSQRIGVTALPQLGGHGDQMIVVDPDNVVRSQNFRKLVGEMAVHAKIAGDVAPREFGHVDVVVQNRPENAVGKTIVIFFVILLRQIGGDVACIFAFDCFGLDLVGLHDLAAPAEPNAGGLLENRRKRDFEPAGALRSLAWEGRSVGNEN